MTRPLALDIDGTITTADGRIDPRAVDELHRWDSTIVLATGMAFPYPVVLSRFLGIPEIVVAENGGIVSVEETVHTTGDCEIAWKVIDEYRDQGGRTDWSRESSINRWRETEAVVSPNADERLLRSVADDYDVEVVFTGYAYHIKTVNPTKAEGLQTVCDLLNIDIDSFIAIGDSANDIEMFDAVGDSFAVGNAEDPARDAAGIVVKDEYMDGTISILESIRQVESK